VDVRGHLERVTIDELCNQKFKSFLYYQWIQSFVIPRYGIGSHKKGRFLQALKSRSLLYTPTTCTKTTNQNLVWLNFEEFYA
jgi:hypothetical protein